MDNKKGCALSILIFFVVVFGGYAAAAAELHWWTPWMMNQQTEIYRNTNQYVDTQQTKLNGLVRQYDQLLNYNQSDQIKRQERDLVDEMCDASSKVDAKYVPASAARIISTEGCY